MDQLASQTAIVTGASRGIGEAAARELDALAAGHNSCGVDLEADEPGIRAHCPQARGEFQRRDRAGTVSEVDDDRRIVTPAQSPGLRAGQPAVLAAQTVGVRRPPRHGANRSGMHGPNVSFDRSWTNLAPSPSVALPRPATAAVPCGTWPW